jgi:hypothetical protein
MIVSFNFLREDEDSVSGSVVDPKLYIFSPDPDMALTLIPDSDPD